jgi:acylphosphatase
MKFKDHADATPSFGGSERPGTLANLSVMSRERLQIYYSGHVQGVGFRFTTKSVAQGFAVTGVVRNLADGRVELVIEGERAELEGFRRAIQDSEVGGFIRQEETTWSPAKNEYRGFEIVR